METKLELIAKKAKENPKLKFTALIHHINEQFLTECYKQLNRQSAPGIDRVTMQEYGKNLQEKVKQLVEGMKKWQYRPQPVRRAYIPKEANNQQRAIGIPAVEDKIIQMAIAKILTAIYEADFLECSYGYRPGKSCHDALNAVDKIIMTEPINYILDCDIRGFFDNVSHKQLVASLRQRIGDKNFIRLIVRFLKAGIMEEGKYRDSEKGVAQGNILSPVLSNVYLHYVLDQWFENETKKQLQGQAQQIRYCDDFIICVERKEDAERILQQLRERLKEYGLEIAEEKTRMIEFGRRAALQAQQRGEKTETFNFLGFTHYCDKTRRGKFKVGRRTNRKRLRAKLKELNSWLKAVRSQAQIKEWWSILGAKLAGHYRYYGVSGNYPSIRRFHQRAMYLVRKWLNRRSQKKSYTEKGFYQFLEYYPLPKPKIYHNLYTLSSR